VVSGRLERRLTAIVAADVAGYSRLTGLDEEGTHSRLKDHLRTLVDPKITEHRGRIVKNTGDGMLAEFGSVVDAVRCAVDVQRGMAERNVDVSEEKRIDFRIGINVGDVIIDGGDVFGDGVNVAARLEGIAEPGGICVSARVQEYAEGQLDIAFEDLGEHQLKNIERPVRVYRVPLGGVPRAMRPALVLPDKPSIAVLPFQNLSGDPEQEYFADGIVEEIITALSRMRWLFVIARHSSFTYKGRIVDLKQVGRELGVRYVLQGSVRKGVNQVRITGQLIDATTGAHIWADRFDGSLEHIFELQDRVTTSVIGAIAPKLEQAEIERASRKPTESLDAYDCYLRGVARVYSWTSEATEEALQLFCRAIDRDPDFAAAHAMAAFCYLQRKSSGSMADAEQVAAKAVPLARRAVQLGKDDAVALCWAALVLAYVAGEPREGAAFIDRALMLNPNLSMAWYFGGWIRSWLGEPDAAIEHLTRAMRLNPVDPRIIGMYAAMGAAHGIAGRYDEALSWVEKALWQRPDFVPALRVAAVNYAFAGRLNEARQVMTRLRPLDPTLRIANLRDLFGPYRAEDLERTAEALRKIGVPE
jgi:TolB-like protein